METKAVPLSGYTAAAKLSEKMGEVADCWLVA